MVVLFIQSDGIAETRQIVNGIKQHNMTTIFLNMILYLIPPFLRMMIVLAFLVHSPTFYPSSAALYISPAHCHSSKIAHEIF